MKHLNLELERLEQRIAPGLLNGGVSVTVGVSGSGGSNGSKSGGSKGGGSKTGGSKSGG